MLKKSDGKEKTEHWSEKKHIILSQTKHEQNEIKLVTTYGH